MVIETKPISYLYSIVKGSDELFDLRLFRNIFDTGTYVAGGLLRKIVRDGDCAGLPEYFSNGGDIDVFAPDVTSFNSIIALRQSWKRTMGGNAWFNDFKAGSHDAVDMLGRSSVTLQAIDKQFMPPAQMIASFDLVNCEFATDGRSFWFETEAIELEKDRTLKANFAGDLLGPRIAKYCTKHRYDRLEKETKRMLANWLRHNMARGWKGDGRSRVVNHGESVMLMLAKMGLVSDITLLALTESTISLRRSMGVEYIEYADFEDRRIVKRPNLERQTVDVFLSQIIINAEAVEDIAPGDEVTFCPVKTDARLVPLLTKSPTAIVLSRHASKPGLWNVKLNNGDVVAAAAVAFSHVKKR